MVNVEIADVLKCLHNELVNEIDNQNAGRLDDVQIQILADCIKNSVKTTHNKFCEPEEKIIYRFPPALSGVFSLYRAILPPVMNI